MRTLRHKNHPVVEDIKLLLQHKAFSLREAAEYYTLTTGEYISHETIRTIAGQKTWEDSGLMKEEES